MRSTGTGILCARQVGNGRAEAGADLMVLRCDDAAGLCSRTEHQLLVKRLPGVHVDHASGNTLCCQHFFGLECLVYQNTGGNNGHVLAVTQRNALADLKIRAIRVNRGKSLADQAHVGRIAAGGQLPGQCLGLCKIARVDNDCIRDVHVQRTVLKRHVSCAVECCAYAGVGADNVYRQFGVACCQKCLIEHTAGSKAAERVRENGQAGGCHAGGNAHGVLLRDACVKGLGRERLQQLSSVDAAHQVAVDMHQLWVLRFCTPEEWEKLVELFTFGCKVAQQIGNPYIIVVPTVTSEICTRNEKEIFDDSVKVLNELADIAEPYGVKLSFEPIGDKKWCVNSVRQALEIVNAVNRDSVGLTVDCINVYLHDKCADVDFIRKIPKEKLFVFHINDCEDLPLGILDHCHRLMPGLGAIPVQEVADAVQAVGYDGPACLELFRPEYWRMPAEDVIRMGAETTRPFLG